MLISTSTLRVEQAISPEELAAGLAFVNEQYNKAFGVIPSAPDHLLVAYHASRIVGTIGINVWNEETGLRLAKLYSFDHVNFTIPIDLPRSVEFARWACESSGVACTLLHAATCFALKLNKRYVWCEHSLAVNRICRKYGIVFHPITDATLNINAIEKYHQAFYDSTDARLFLFSLEQARPALAAYVESEFCR
ncbi:hypothetical protein BH11PAT2_BH11PAT2_00690 [soil metagenome]